VARREWLLRPVPLLAVAAASLLILIVSALEVRNPTCAGVRPYPTWFTVVSWTLAPLSVLAVFGGVLTFGTRLRWHPVGAFVVAVAVTALWAAVGLYITFGILAGPCLS